MRYWRKMTWVLVGWCSLIVLWVVAGANSASQHCSAQTGDAYLSAQNAQDACSAGAGIGVALILLVGFVGFVFFALIWMMTRPRDRA